MSSLSFSSYSVPPGSEERTTLLHDSSPVRKNTVSGPLENVLSMNDAALEM